jgi:hypothetical protein
MRSEVILLLYDRPEHSFSVVDALVQSGVSRVRAFIDGARTAETERRQERLLEGLAARNRLDVVLHRHARHLGLAASVRFALDVVLAEADAAVVLEDDCVPRPGAMEFFDAGLTALRDDRRVRSLCGYLFPCPFIRSGNAPLLLRRFCSWGWATWRVRWQDYETDLGSVVDRLARHRMFPDDIAGDLAALCRSTSYLENRADVWSLSWVLEHYATGTYCVYPSESMIDNIGFDGTGRNCRPTDDFATGRGETPPPATFARLFHCDENEETLKRFMTKHGLKIYAAV